MPKTDVTRVPKLDETFTASESKFHKNIEAKATEDLVHIQACCLDVVRPLVNLIEGLDQGQFTPKDVKDCALDALKLVGNAIAHTSTIRRKRVLKVCNPDIVSLAENQELYTSAPPQLFGEGFENKIKDRAQALKVLHQATTNRPSQNQKPTAQSLANRKPYFQQYRPSYPQRGGGYANRGQSGNTRFYRNQKPKTSQK